MSTAVCAHPISLQTAVALDVNCCGLYCNDCDEIIPGEPTAEQIQAAAERQDYARYGLGGRRRRPPRAPPRTRAAVGGRNGRSLAG